MSLSEKAAYLKGLAEGLGIGTESKEEKVLTSVIDLMSDIVKEIDELSKNSLSIGDELDSLSDHLEDIEEYVFNDLFDDEDYDDEDEDDDEDDECDCEFCRGGADSTFEIECPNCGTEFELSDDDFIKGSAACSSCGEEIELDFDDEDDDGDD